MKWNPFNLFNFNLARFGMGPEMGQARNGTVGHEMGRARNRTDTKWPGTKWSVRDGPVRNGIYPSKDD